HFVLPDSLRYSMSRARRIHIHQIIVLPLLTPAQMEVFFTGWLFGGVFPSRVDARAWLGLLIALPMQIGNFVLWSGQATYLLIRGALNKPIPHPSWAVGDKYLSPLANPGTPPKG
ncbi:MAG: hypothetical protein ABI743_13430, partial [bacterium]